MSVAMKTNFSPLKSPSLNNSIVRGFLNQRFINIVHGTWESRFVNANKISKLQYAVNMEIKRKNQSLTDFVINLLEEVKKYFGCDRAVMVPVDPYLTKILIKDAHKDYSSRQHVYKIDYIDKYSADKSKLF
jgi:hypothetical protein